MDIKELKFQIAMNSAMLAVSRELPAENKDIPVKLMANFQTIYSHLSDASVNTVLRTIKDADSPIPC